ncbi:type II secretion system F family protein [bacterium]|nr:type II secretion system F family protein [bacterium]
MKQAKDFAQQDTGETFQLKGKSKLSKDERIVLSIGQSLKKVKLRKGANTVNTGNFLFDTYAKLNNAIISINKVKTQEKAVFFRLLAVMVDAGIPIIKSLQTLSEQNKKNPKFSKIILDMALKIEEGESLSGSMEQHPKVFNESEIGMIRSGEVSGHLNNILRDLAKQTEKNAQTLSKVKGALTYPTVVLAILFLVMFLMMTMVIPNITKLFIQTGTKLPTITKVVIVMSNFMREKSYIIIGAIVIFGIVFTLWKRTKNGRYQWHIFLLHLPIFGGLIRKSTLAQFARTLGNLLGSGVTINQSLNIISNAMNNEVYKRKIKLAGDDIRGGIPLAETLRNSSYFPIMFVNMIAIGEETAQLETISKRVSDFYDEQVDESVKGLTKIIEPIIMVFVGLAVGGLVAAIMLPIMSLADVASNM